MNALVMYDSQFGNTEQIGRAIGQSVGTAQIIRAAQASTSELAACELLIIGGPTQRHSVSPALRTLLKRLPRGTLCGTCG
jgi:flavorubredoxin